MKLSTQVMVYGSGECDQLGKITQLSLGLGDQDYPESKIPKLVSLLENIPIVKICCGALHTLALSNEGRIYSWGNNDEGALGREGEKNSNIKGWNQRQ